jgi:heat shock protein HslJ
MNPRRVLALMTLPALLALAACGSGSTASSSSAASAVASESAAVVDLAGTSWTLASYTGADGSSTTATAAPEASTLTFAADGTVAGTTGCNAFTGTYEQQLLALSITPGPMTLKACTGPVAAQEQAILAALPLVASFTTTSGLTLTDASGAELLVYTAAATGLEGSSWTATGINNGKEAVVGTATTGSVTADFGADGTLSGSGGCNNYTASYTISGSDAISIGEIGSTKKMCDDATMTTEQQYFAALAASTTFSLDANSLTLRDASGAMQVTFAPAS